MYRYLIGYVALEGSQHGAIEIGRPVPISSVDHIHFITAELRDHKNDPSLLVTAFSRFEETR